MHWLWAIVLFDLHYFLGNVVVGPLGKLLSIAIVLLLATLIFDAPRLLGRERGWVWNIPFALFVVAGVLAFPGAENKILARTAVQYLVIYYLLALATVVYIKTPQQAAPILAMFGWRFLWWMVWARQQGLVPWHPTMSNYDGFGGLMVMGTAVCFWFGLAVPRGWRRNALMGIAALCVIGVVTSMARGAFLALVAVVGVIWLRSPRKGMTTLALVAAAGIVMLAASLLFEDNFFYNEMMSVFEEGTEEGTGAHRWALWTAAFRVWQEHPIIGVGPGNFGVFASTFFKPYEINLFDDPGTFWGINLHNAYMQILSEMGLIGVTGFVALTIDFFRKNRALREVSALGRWAEQGGASGFDLRLISLGLEGAMIGVMLGNMVYAALFEPWFATLWAANRMLWGMTRPRPGGAAPPASPPARVAPSRVTRRSGRHSLLG